MKVFSNMSNKDYHEHGSDYISSSFVKSVAKHSIAKALQPIEPNQALIFGDAMHTYFESKTDFHSRFVTFDDQEVISSILEAPTDKPYRWAANSPPTAAKASSSEANLAASALLATLRLGTSRN